MHLVKWIRKNTSRIMVFVIIFAMLAFVVGQFGLQMIVSLMGGGPQVIATYNNDNKIKSDHFGVAQSELAVLRMLMADQLLLRQSSSGFTSPLLLHLLMPESPFGGEIAAQMKQAVQRGQLPITLEQLDDYFSQPSERPEILWILLKNEAYNNGFIISTENARQVLSRAIPQLSSNQFDAATLVNHIISKNNISEEQIMRIFADLMSIVAHTNNVLDCHAVTTNQIKASLGRSKERIDADFVKIPAEWFIDKESEVTNEQLQSQFEAYKATTAGNPTEDNPFGFGYELPKRIQLEYMILLRDDVKAQTDAPTAEEMETFYSNNIELFQKSIPVDPNDPESETTTITQTFAEVQPRVRREVEDEKTESLTNVIFSAIKEKTESGFDALNVDEATVAELQKAAGDYMAVGDELSKKYVVPIAAGKTGWLDAETFGQEKILTGLSMRRGQNYLRLLDLAFAATEEKPEPSRLGMPSIRVWENIGPLDGGYYSEEDNKYYRLKALVRVVGVEPAAVTDDVNLEYDARGVELGEELITEDTVFSLKDIVKEDILLLNAMDTAKARAEELVVMINEKGWDEAVETYNETYARTEPGADPNGPDTHTGAIEVTEAKQQLRISQSEIAMAKRMIQQNPASAQYIQNRIITNILNNKLYALLDEAKESTDTIQTVLEFPQQSSYYVVKQVTRQPATIKDYQDNKTQMAMQLSMANTGELSLVHLSPENITSRMNLEYKLQEPADESEEPLPTEEDES